MKIVRFINSAAPYTGGDIAGFSDAQADKYISLGVAVEWEGAVKESAPKTVVEKEEQKIIDPMPAPAKPVGPYKKATPVTKGV